MEKIVKSELKQALERLGEKYGLGAQQLRLRISKPNGSLKLHVMQATQIVGEEELKSVLGVGKVDVFNKVKMVNDKMVSAIESLRENEEITPEELNLRIYAKDTLFTPAIHLFNGGKSIRNVELNEIL